MHFRLFGFPVHVHPLFFVVVALLGARQSDLGLILVWVAAVFVSILVHELGHASVARAFGLRPSIQLYSMGGVTRFTPQPRLTHRQSMAISLAGPGAGFLLGGIIWVASLGTPPAVPFVVHQAMRDLLWVNFGWGLLNLLPILPLDGGNVLRSFLQGVRRNPDDRLALQISISFGGLACLAALTYGLLWAAMIAALITWDNYQSLARFGWGRRISS